MDNPNKKKHWRMKSSPLKGPRVPSRERSTITYSRLPGSWEARLHHRRSREGLSTMGVFTCRTCPPKVPLKKYTKWVSLSLMIYKWGVDEIEGKTSSASKYRIAFWSNVTRALAQYLRTCLLFEEDQPYGDRSARYPFWGPCVRIWLWVIQFCLRKGQAFPQDVLESSKYQYTYQKMSWS